MATVSPRASWFDFGISKVFSFTGTNLLISGTLWQGSPARLVNAVLSIPGTLCLSAEIVTEFGEVLAREEFAIFGC